jgi:hypothetical protein
MNAPLQAKSDIHTWLDTLFPWHEPMRISYLADVKSVQTDRTGKLMSAKEVLAYLSLAGMNTNNLKLNAVKNALQRFCSAYTNTLGRERELMTVKATLKDGQLCQSRNTDGTFHYSKYVMPPKAEDN